MALIKCPECGKEISDKASACPNCGCPSSEFRGEEKAELSDRPKEFPPEQQPIPRKKSGCGTFLMIILAWIALLVLIGLFYGGSDKKANKKEETDKFESNSEILNKDETVKEINFEEEMDVFLNDEYFFITNEDLKKYSPNMEGAKVYVVTDVDDIKDDMIQSTLSGGYRMSSFHVGDKFSKYQSGIQAGDTVAVLGTVARQNDYGFAGNSVEIRDCLVFAKGEEANKYKKSVSDERLSQYFVVTKEVADMNEISESEYRSLCENINYEDVLRNPDNNKGKYCVLSGNVNQIIEGLFGIYTIYIEDAFGDKWECSYLYKDGESHLLKGDSVTVYGKCEGTTTSTTILGEQVTLPKIDVKYLNQGLE